MTSPDPSAGRALARRAGLAAARGGGGVRCGLGGVPPHLL